MTSSIVVSHVTTPPSVGFLRGYLQLGYRSATDELTRHSRWFGVASLAKESTKYFLLRTSGEGEADIQPP
jgi:hypothetical protein